MTAPRAVRLLDGRAAGRPFVAAQLRSGCPAQLLDAVEREWATARKQLAAAAAVEHARWNWRNKSDSVAGRHRLVAVECEGQVQGLMAVASVARAATLSRGS